MKTIRIMTACAAALLFASCLQVDEPAGIEAIRNAKAELISAEAQFKLAETAYKNAEAAYQQALAEFQVLQNKLEELNLAKQTAESEQHIQTIEQQMELAIYTHQKSLLEKKTELAKAEQEYAETLSLIAATADQLTKKEQEIITKYTQNLSTLKSDMSALNTDMQTYTNNYLTAKYNFEFDYEIQKAQYQRNIDRAKKDLADREKFVEFVKALDATAPVADYLAKIDEVQAQMDDIDAQITALKAEKAEKQEAEEAIVNEEDKLNNEKTDLGNQKTDIGTQITNLQKYDNQEVFYRVTLSVPAANADAIGTIVISKLGVGTQTGLVEDAEGKWTAPSGSVDVVYQTATVETFVDAVIAAAKLKTELKDYVTTLESYKKAITDAKAANDAQVEELKAQQVEIDKQLVDLTLQLQELATEKIALNTEITAIGTETSGDIKVLADYKGQLNTLKSTYEGLVSGTQIWVPSNISDIISSGGLIQIPEDNPATPIDESKALGSQINVTWTPVAISAYGNDAEKLQDAFETWAIYAEYYLKAAQAEVTKMETRLADYLVAENPERYAQQLELSNLEYQMKITQMEYETKAQLFDYYSKLLKDFLAAVTSGETPTPPADDPQPDEPGEGEGGEGEGGEEA